MKILVVAQYFWPETFRINDLTKGLLERGHEITVLTGIPNYPGGRFFAGYGLLRNRRQDFHGAEVIRVPLVPRRDGGGLRLALNYLSFALFATILAPFYLRKKFDCIFVYAPSPITVCLPALVLKKIKPAQVFLWVQDLWPESLSAAGAVKNQTVLDLFGRLVRFIYRRCDKVLVQSPAFISAVRAQGVPSDKILFFPNAVEKNYQPMSRQDDAIKYKLPAGFRVVFAGNIGAAQDFETILAAAERLSAYPDIQWIILGEGRKSAWVKEQVELRGLTSTFHLLGRYPLEDMNGFFAQADAMLVTLKKDPIFALTIPSKIQSYMACGKPIIAGMDGEGARLITESGAGMASPAEDAEALAGSVLALYGSSAEQRDAMGQSGLAYCEEHFEREKLVSRLEEWMQNASCRS